MCVAQKDQKDQKQQTISAAQEKNSKGPALSERGHSVSSRKRAIYRDVWVGKEGVSESTPNMGGQEREYQQLRHIWQYTGEGKRRV